MENWLFRRPVESDVETPPECHLQAMYSAYKNETVPEDVYEAVLGYAVVRKDELKEVLDFVNKSAGREITDEERTEKMAKLGIALVSSYGIESFDAVYRRGQKLNYYLNGLILAADLGNTE